MKTVIENRYTQNVIVESELNMKEAVVANKVNLCGADLRGASLCDANLRDADLRDAEIKATQKETIIDSIGLIIEK